jgi:hypothetical protein
MEMIGLVMDFLLLLFLGAMMFFAWSLSKNINVFRKSRKELDKLVQDLSRQIEKADTAVAGLKNSARDAGRGLQDLVNEAKALSEELQIMTESGDNLAGRLERLAERNRDIAERIERAGGTSAGLVVKEPALPRPQEQKRAPVGPSFAIRDRDIETGDDDSDFTDEIDDGVHSRAERELLEALKKNGKTRAGGVS